MKEETFSKNCSMVLLCLFTRHITFVPKIYLTNQHMHKILLICFEISSSKTWSNGWYDIDDK